MIFKQSVDFHSTAQAVAQEGDKPFDFLGAIHRDFDKSDSSQWSKEKREEELAKFQAHWYRAEAQWKRMTTPTQVIKADEPWRTCAEDSFSDEAYQHPEDDFYYTNTEAP